jgi:WD40 repeat protein
MSSPSPEKNVQLPPSLEDLREAAAQAQLRSRMRTVKTTSVIAGAAMVLMTLGSLVLYQQASVARRQAVIAAQQAELALAARGRAENLALEKKNTAGILAVSSDRKAFVSQAGYLVDARSNSPIAQLTTQDINAAQFSADGTKIVLGAGPLISVFDRSGALLKAFSIDGVLSSIRFSPDGKQIAVVSVDGEAELWTLEGQLLRKFVARVPIRVAAFSPDKSHLVTGLETGDINVWDLDTGREIIRFRGLDPTPPTLLGFSSDNQQLLAAYQGGRIAIWDLATTKMSTLFAFTP